MAVTQNTYTGNGSTVLYNFTFPYLQQTDVQVKLDGATQATTTYSFANATTIQFNSAPTSGVKIIIFRNTDNDNKKATFYPGSAIKAEDLNDNLDQILYVAQEVDNNAMSSLGDTQMQGDLEFGQGMGLIFEGGTTDANETRLGVLDPTADRVINLPNVSGTVVTTGDTGSVTSTMISDGTIVSGDIADGTLVNADVNASAAIAGTKVNPDFGSQTISTTGNIAVSGTVDGRDVSTDGSKLDGIETAATADQTAAEIRTLTESATDSNVFTDADHTKLNAIEAGATADQTAAEVKSLYESNSDTNNFTDAEKTFLSDVSATATEINYTTNVTSDIQSQIDGKQPLDSELTTLAGMQSGTASQLASGTPLSATTTNLNITQGMTKATSLTTNSDTEFPTSKAVNDRILTVTNALGGFVAIADKDNFPTSHPDPSGNAGTVVSISNATGISVNSSGVGTLATRAGGSDAVIINGFPSALRGGVTVGGTTNANPYVLPANVGLQVQTTGTAHTYDYHKYLINEEDANKLSGEIQDFQERYRVAASAPTSSLDDGDLYFDTTANKMKVYNASSSSWDDVATPGNFLLNTISSSSGSGGGSATFNGTATRFTLSNPPDQYAQQLLVSINGVIQKPNSGTSPSEGFAIDGNDIIFSAAPASGADYFIVTQGSSVNIGTPSDNTVSTAKVQSGAITNDKVNASAAIDGTKISPVFGSQTITTTGQVAASDIAVSGTAPVVSFTDTDANSDFKVEVDGGVFKIKDITNSNATRVKVESDGTTNVLGNLDVGAGVDVTGNITQTGIQTFSKSVYDEPTSEDFFRIKFNDTGGINNDVGIGQPDANSLAFNTVSSGSIRFYNGTDGEMMRLDASGRLGLGTISPGVTLDIEAVTPTIRLTDSDASGTPECEIKGGGGDLILSADRDDEKASTLMQFKTDGSTAMTIDSSQHVGIGSASNGRKLHLHEASSDNNLISITNSTTGSTTSDGILIGMAGDESLLISNKENNGMQLHTNNTERVRINASGDVEIMQDKKLIFVYAGGSTHRASITADSSDNLKFTTGSSDVVRMTLSGTGRLSTAVLALGSGNSHNSAKLVVQGSGNASSTNSVFIKNSDETPLFQIRNDGVIYTGIDGLSPYNLTTGNNANAVLTSDGILRRHSSSKRYKKDIVDATWGLADVLKLKPITFKSNVVGEFEDNKTYAGFTAEDIHDLGLTEFVVYNDVNEPDALNYGSMVALMAKAIQELNTKVAALEAA